MNQERWLRVKQVFDHAVSVEAPQRTSVLDRDCDGDAELRREVESLLSAHEHAGTAFLKTPAADLKAAVPTVVSSRAGPPHRRLSDRRGNRSRRYG